MPHHTPAIRPGKRVHRADFTKCAHRVHERGEQHAKIAFNQRDGRLQRLPLAPDHLQLRVVRLFRVLSPEHNDTTATWRVERVHVRSGV